MTKVSIITVNYNDLEGLKKTIASVQAQACDSVEHIIIDGGSTDGSAAYIEAQQALFSYWVSEPDKGVYSGMNKGIAKAQGEYFLFLNAGDHLYAKDVLSQALPYLTQEAIIYFDLEVVEGDARFIKAYPDTLSFSYFVEDTLPHPATFIAKSAFAKAGTYKEDFKIVSDWKFFIDALCKHQLSYKRVPQPLSTFYIGGMSSDPKNSAIKQSERAAVLQKDYAIYLQDIEDTLRYTSIVTTLRTSRIINTLVKLGFLNKF